MQREGQELGASLSLLTQLTAGLSGGQLLMFVQQLAARMLQAGAAGGGQAGAGGSTPTGQGQHQPAASVEEVALELLPVFALVSKEEVQALQAWTATVHSPLPPEVGTGGRGTQELASPLWQPARAAGSENVSRTAAMATAQPDHMSRPMLLLADWPLLACCCRRLRRRRARREKPRRRSHRQGWVARRAEVYTCGLGQMMLMGFPVMSG